MFLGAHVSIAGGLEKAFMRGEALGCEAIQIFSKNQRRWVAKPITEEEAKLFKETWRKSSVETVTIHDSYLINLASPKKDSLEKSREAFLEEMRRAQVLGVPHLVFHPGAHQGAGEEEGLRRIAEGLNIFLEKVKGVMPVLETTAGQGTNLGYRFEQLRFVMDLVDDPKRVGVCLDTCHIVAAGYDMRTEKSYEKMVEELDQVVGLENVHVIHLNDCRSELGSRVDRHEHIGQGNIGLEGFRLLLNDERFKGRPMLLETPGGEEWYAKNLEVLRGLLEK
ncbi:MAG: deoxyribonuclease IV [Methanobacteriota archaeon]|nr:MAG: deoxyribonuclease IV [Euryarchaeota archaeon]